MVGTLIDGRRRFNLLMAMADYFDCGISARWIHRLCVHRVRHLGRVRTDCRQRLRLVEDGFFAFRRRLDGRLPAFPIEGRGRCHRVAGAFPGCTRTKTLRGKAPDRLPILVVSAERRSRGHQTARAGRYPRRTRPQLQCQPRHDFTTDKLGRLAAYCIGGRQVEVAMLRAGALERKRVFI